MKIPYEITGFVGHGGVGSVFAVKYEEQEVAMKIQYGFKSAWDKLIYCGRKEFEYLERVKGIQGIPESILFLEGVHGSYEGLGLDVCGKTLAEVAPCYIFCNPQPNYYGGAFLFELLVGINKVDENNKQSPEFFDKLEIIAAQVHKRGLSLPWEYDIFELNGEPYILDWYPLTDFNEEKRRDKKDSIKGDFHNIGCWRRKWGL